MNKKILAFVYNGKKFLSLRNNPQDPKHGGDFWFTVTGSIENGENEKDAIKREVKEETNLGVTDLFDLNWGSVYIWNNEEFNEKNHIVFVKEGTIRLNKENVDYEWLELAEFVRRIKWGLDKKELVNVLRAGLKKELFFKKPKIEDFRK